MHEPSSAPYIQAVADSLRVNTALTSCHVLKNKLDVAVAKSLVEALKDRDVSLSGIRFDQTDFEEHELETADAILLASDLSKAGVSGSLTSVWSSGRGTRP